jgi:hypothetical protein
MIHEVVPIVVSELREFLEARFGIAEDQVVMANIVDQDGTIAINGENRLIVSLINIERDGSNQQGGMGYADLNPPLHVNIYVLFSAYFSTTNYDEALKFISGVIGFFQGKNYFDSHNTPMLNSSRKIRAELVNVDWRELSNLWAAIGAKYLPSVVFRFRTLEMNEDLINDEIPPVSVTDDLI